MSLKAWLIESSSHKITLKLNSPDVQRKRHGLTSKNTPWIIYICSHCDAYNASGSIQVGAYNTSLLTYE